MTEERKMPTTTSSVETDKRKRKKKRSCDGKNFASPCFPCSVPTLEIFDEQKLVATVINGNVTVARENDSDDSAREKSPPEGVNAPPEMRHARRRRRKKRPSMLSLHASSSVDASEKVISDVMQSLTPDVAFSPPKSSNSFFHVST